MCRPGDGQVPHSLSEDDASINFEAFQRHHGFENIKTEHITGMYFPLKWQMGLLYSESQVGWGGGVVIGWDTNQKLCQQLLSEQGRWLSCTLLCWSVFVIHHRCYTLDFKAVLFVLPALTWWLLSVTMTMTSLSPSSLRTDTTVS